MGHHLHGALAPSCCVLKVIGGHFWPAGELVVLPCESTSPADAILSPWGLGHRVHAIARCPLANGTPTASAAAQG